MRRDRSFLDKDIQYKTGIRTPEYDALQADAKRRALLKYQIEQEEKRQQQIRNQWQTIKDHRISFSQMHINFKLAFLLSVIVFVANIMLSIIFQEFSIVNISNLIASIIIFISGRHLYLRSLNLEESKLCQMIRDSFFQLIEDILNVTFPKFILDKTTMISDLIVILSAGCWTLLPSTNILYATCVILSLLALTLSIGQHNQEEIKSHFQILTSGLWFGIIVKTIYNFIFVSKFLQLDYMNIALLFLFTCLRMWILDEY